MRTDTVLTCTTRLGCRLFFAILMEGTAGSMVFVAADTLTRQSLGLVARADPTDWSARITHTHIDLLTNSEGGLRISWPRPDTSFTQFEISSKF